MKLSDKAIQELRQQIQRKYNNDFQLTEEDLNGIGMFLLTALAEGLKLKNVV